VTAAPAAAAQSGPDARQAPPQQAAPQRPTAPPLAQKGSDRSPHYAQGAPVYRPAPEERFLRFEESAAMSKKRAEQLNKAQAKAVKDAKKNQARDERIYARAMKEAKKHQPEGGRK
ncbi:MAG: hypothetical protein IJK98_08490, partial [Clostridia bacterium]|nr:hypothetical protein [Clostridia bacterium]